MEQPLHALRRALVGAAILVASTARAGISIAIDQPAPGSPDVVLRWAAEGAGPFTLLRRELADRARVAEALPLDRVADVRRTGLAGGAAMLSGETAFGPGTDLHVYQLIDESDGSCSNLGYVALRRGFAWRASATLSLPARTSIHSLGQVLDAWPFLSAAEISEPESCRLARLERDASGTRRGVDELIPRGRAVLVTLGATGEIVVAGASEWTTGTPVQFAPATCVQYSERMSLPFGLVEATGDALLCANATDNSGDGAPDACSGMLFDGTHEVDLSLQPRHGGDGTPTRIVVRNRLLSPHWSGTNFDADPVAGLLAAETTSHVPESIVLATHDAGAPAACRCADSDGDGEDDCTERLRGSNPNDPSSHGPDADGDGVRDDADDCPVAADPAQADGDADGLGDACDPDPLDPSNASADGDSDGVLDGYDNCEILANPTQANADQDFLGDACDDCPTVTDDQADSDADGLGDACDPCPSDPVPDSDGDGTCSNDDCPAVANPTQSDVDGDGFGDACDCATTGPVRPDPIVLRIVSVYTSLVRELVWTPTDPGDHYDVASGLVADVFGRGNYAPSTCLAIGLPSPSFLDGPRSGDTWYLVRSRSACSATSWGSGSVASDNPVLALDQGDQGCP